jgi:hypothetical protein
MKLLRHLVGAALLLALLVPAAAAAESRSFVTLGEEFPTGGNNLQFGPAFDYPSTATVSGVPGIVTKVSVTVFSLTSASPDDIDMVLVGPNEEQVMLMSDACGSTGFSDRTWTFDDAAPTFLPDSGPCNGPSALGTFKPSNYENPALDDLSKEGGGPPPPYSNALSDLTGGSAEGEWELFVLDDNSAATGFVFNAWALNLEVEPPPPPSPLIQTVFVPAPATLAAPGTGTAVAPKPGPTGKRAAALAKCKAKKGKAQKAKCKAKARKLPA